MAIIKKKEDAASVQGTWKCNDCGNPFPVESEPVTCPRCGSTTAEKVE